MADEAASGPALEFEAIRAEILQTASAQTTLYLFNIVAAGSVLSFALSSSDRALVALAIPLVSYLLAVRYYQLGLSIAEMGVYIRVKLSPKVSGGFGWEAWLNARRTASSAREPVRSRIHTVAVFSGPAVAGWLVGTQAVLGGDYSRAELVGLLVLCLGLAILTVWSVMLWRQFMTTRREFWTEADCE